MIDMKDVDITFLSSKEHIATAILNLIKLIDTEKFILRSHHCSIDDDEGKVNCFGQLDEGHISTKLGQWRVY